MDQRPRVTFLPRVLWQVNFTFHTAQAFFRHSLNFWRRDVRAGDTFTANTKLECHFNEE
jgi:hypothetical protein